MNCIHTIALVVIVSMLTACSGVWNNPYPEEDDGQNILYSSFNERPKHLDPVRSYSSNEYAFIGQIYEPPLQYHYLKRPYELIPLTAREVPKPVFLDKNFKKLSRNAKREALAYSVYTIRIKPDIKFQPHPAFARDGEGNFLYHDLTPEQLENIYALEDFKETGSRELTVLDYVYQIKRIAQPSLHSPIYGTMSEYILGLKELSQELKAAEDALKAESNADTYLDLNQFHLPGVKVIDKYSYQITIKGHYPQLVYWLAMPFFAPMPEEAVKFYSQPSLKEKNISLNWYPVGTGAYMLTVNNPNRQMVLEKNPNYRQELYPTWGEEGDEDAGLLRDAGSPMPFIDKVVYNLEKESIPIWNKFLQGYYDTSGITSDSFDQAIQLSAGGDSQLTDAMREKEIRLSTAVATSIFYMGFNMRDPVVGGLDKKSKKLRQAISIAIDQEEYISIFANGRGVPAQGPIPPGIFGYVPGKEGINPYVYDWVDDRPKRKSIEAAKKLMVEAGYPNGIDKKTGKPLVLHLDITASGPDDKARLNWYRKQFEKIDIQLVIRDTMYNRFQEKMHKGTAQIFIWGWNADYPDPENFLFMLYGPNSKVDVNGENAANYANPAFDKLFDKMKNMANGKRRQKVINQMVDILRQDATWIFGFHPKRYGLYHHWYQNAKPNLMAHNTLQYKRISPLERERKRKEWNDPIVWPVVLLVVILIVGTIPAYVTYRQKEHMASKG